MDQKEALFLYFAMSNESLHKNPGNISVFKMLMDKNYAHPIDEKLEKKFRTKYPKYGTDFGWLWILYKYESAQDIDATITKLNDLRRV